MPDASKDAPSRPGLLIVDDDPLITETLGFFLGNAFDIVCASTRPECLERVRTLPTVPPLALVDLGLPPLPHRPDEGFALIADLLALSPTIKIVVLSGQSDGANARHARTLGATDFIAKPADPERLRLVLFDALTFREAEIAPEDTPAFAEFIGESAPVGKLREQLKVYADSPFPILIEGESGSGKEIVAGTCLHRLTRRRDRPYFALNCAAISPTLVEPTLFGYARGAFTGATTAKAGYFEDADDGTLFLDEIGELPLDLQPKLLRVLENGEYQRVGDTQTRISRARIIAATNRDLSREVREGRFRADLYHRLSVFTVRVPALREMGRDRLLLLDHFRRLYSRQTGQRPFTMDAVAEQRWMAYPFPGNVRELRNIVIRLTAKFPGAQVDAANLGEEFDSGLDSLPETMAIPPRDPEELLAMALRDLRSRPAFDLDETLRRWETAYIHAAQQLAHGNVSQAARLLGLSRTTLYNRIEALSRPQDPIR